MRKILLGLGVALAAAGAASAQSLPDAVGSAAVKNTVIHGRVTAQCNISGATTANITIALAGADGFLAPGLQSAIQSALAGTGTKAWCSGALNAIRLTSTPLVRNGTSGALAGGFVQAVGYGVGVDVPGAANLLFPGAPDAASDIPLPRLLTGRFGPSGDGATLTWGGAYLNVNPAPVSVSSLFGLTVQTPQPGRRLAAGDYTSQVVLTLAPGV